MNPPTVRFLAAERPGPVLIAANMPLGSVHVTAEDGRSTAELTLRATTDDPVLIDAVQRATLRWNELGGLIVSVPDLPKQAHTTVIRTGRGHTIVQNVSNVSAGSVITGAVITIGGTVTVDGVRVDDTSPTVAGSIEVVALVPPRSGIDLRGQSPSLEARGLFGDITVKTVSGDVLGDTAATLTAETTSGDVRLQRVTESATATTVSGDILLGAAARTVLASSVSGDIYVNAVDAAQISARSVSGDVRVTASTEAVAAGVTVQASSVSGMVARPRQGAR